MTRHTYRNVTTLVVGLILAIGGLAVTITRADSASVPVPHRTVWMKTPCAQEDGSGSTHFNCFWNAGSQGDGQGHSFYVHKIPHTGGVVCYMYVNPNYAKRNDTCFDPATARR